MPYTPIGTILCNRPDTNSIVGTGIFLYSIVGAINSHTVKPPTGINSVMGAGIYRTERTW